MLSYICAEIIQVMQQFFTATYTTGEQHKTGLQLYVLENRYNSNHGIQIQNKNW